MCGIFGVITATGSNYTEGFLTKAINTLGELSQTRGKDSSGLCSFNPSKNQIEVIKGPVPISKLLRSHLAVSSVSKAFSDASVSRYSFGHARLVTNGSQLNDDNNQPVVKDGMVAVHNGIVVNVDKLWEANTDILRNFEIDTEVMLSLVRKNSTQMSLKSAVSKMVRDVFGTVATAMVLNDISKFILATNNGSLYYIQSNDILFFASERFMLNEFEKKTDLSSIGSYKVEQLLPNSGLLIDLDSFEKEDFGFNELLVSQEETLHEAFPISIQTLKSDKAQRSTVVDLNFIHLNPQAEKEQAILDYPEEKIRALKRCTTCLLPETFPFIHFDEKGECNYCKNYKRKNQPKSIQELQKLVEPYRKKSGQADILIPFSGGRDSTYVLHVVKEELCLNPVAFTYDWGMVTDLARRNIARTCGKLGVENIIVAADIHWKRENIRKNIKAWLKNPALGMIPLFMAGDKFFFYYAHKVKKQLGIDLEIWGVNELENTNFKTGFAGLAPQFDKKRIYSISLANQMKLFGYVGLNLLKSPGYINQSMIDSLGSFASRYITPKADYFHLFDYMRWDEKHIEKILFENYDWEKAVDTSSTWRIGDGTASFYNYIYTRVAGFSENDTFRSNQIREGMMSREEALALIYEENKPRYNSLKWYLEIIGLDYESTIKRINEIPALF